MKKNIRKSNDKMKMLAKDCTITSFVVFVILSWFEWRNPESIQMFNGRLWVMAVFPLFYIIYKKKNFFRKYLGIFFWISIFLMPISQIFSFSYPKAINMIISAAVIIFGIFYFSLDSKNTSSAKENLEKNTKQQMIFLGIIISFLFILILPLTKEFLDGDEWHVYNLAKTITETGQLETEWNFFYDQPDFEYKQETPTSIYLAGWFKIFGENISVAHFASFSVAIIFIFYFFFFTKKYFGRTIAYLATLYFATTPFFVYQSIYIRGYMLLFLISMIVYDLSIRIFLEKFSRKTWLKIFLCLLLVYLAQDIRFFSILILVPFILAVLYRLYDQKLKHQVTDKLKKVMAIITCLLLLIIFIFRKQIIPLITNLIPITKSLVKSDLFFSLEAAKMSLLNIPVELFIIALSYFLIFYTVRIINKITFSKKDLRIAFLSFSLLLLHLVYGFFARENLLLPRYTIFLMPLNTIFTIYFLYILLTDCKYLRRKAYTLTAVSLIILFFNINLWTSNTMNGWDSGYNYIDIYKEDETTSETRLKQKKDIMYALLKKELSNESYKNVALITEFFSDPGMAKISSYNKKTDLYGLRLRVYSSRYLKSPNEKYMSIPGYPISIEYLNEIIDCHDTSFAIFPTSKNYNFHIQIDHLEELSFHKISGENIDNSGIEIYKYTKNE